jgi:RHS repeat-associated protein
MTDGGKAVVWDAWYFPFGEARSITGTATNNMRFPGQYFLVESGLAYNWHRHYDPTLGKYLQADPLDFIDGPNIYNYATNTPTMYVDLEGESAVRVVVSAAVSAAKWTFGKAQKAGEHVRKNVHFEGPNEKFSTSGQGRICQVRYKDYAVRLDYQEYIRGQGPEYHLNIGRPQNSIHVPLDPRRWFR